MPQHCSEIVLLLLQLNSFIQYLFMFEEGIEIIKIVHSAQTENILENMKHILYGTANCLRLQIEKLCSQEIKKANS